MNYHFKIEFPKGSKVETLEDVLAGPETEVMDGIQVTKKDDHPIFSQKFLRFFFAGRYRPLQPASHLERSTSPEMDSFANRLFNSR